MILQDQTPHRGGNRNDYHHAESSNDHVLMVNGTINLTTRSKTYDSTPTQDESSKGKALVEVSSSTPPSNESLSIEKHVPDLLLQPPKESN